MTKTKAYREWEFEMRKMKEETYRRYLDTVDDTHPFLVDDYRMEVVRESRRITDFYKPLIQREADMLSEKRRLGQVGVVAVVNHRCTLSPSRFIWRDSMR